MSNQSGVRYPMREQNPEYSKGYNQAIVESNEKSRRKNNMMDLIGILTKLDLYHIDKIPKRTMGLLEDLIDDLRKWNKDGRYF